jgi:hypothetical protein
VDLPDRVAAIVDPVLAHLELHLVDVPLLAEGLAELRRGRVALHLAVLIGQDYDWVLDGSKTIESRFARVRLTPWQAVDVGDLVLIKRPGRPIGGIFRAGVTTHHELVGDTAAELRRRFALRMRATDNEFWTARSHARYATLVNVTVPRPIPALVVPKRDQRGWVILTPRQHP